MRKVFLEMYLKKNLGDDLFLKILAERYPDVEFHSSVRGDYFTDFSFGNIKGKNVVIRLADKIGNKIGFIRKRKYDATVLIGGSMFIEQNKDKNELRRSLNFKYNNASSLFVLGTNFGPYSNQFYYDEHKELFARANDICFRDNYSAKLFGDLRNVRVAPDIVFGLDVKKYRVEQKRKVVISIINLENRKKLEKYLTAYENNIARIAEWYAERNYEVILMSFCKHEGDEEAVGRILRKVSNEKVQPHYYRGDIDRALKQIASSEIVVGTRFHSVILGLVFGKKVLPIIYSDKTKNMLNDIGFGGGIIEINRMDDINVEEMDSELSVYKGIEKLRIDSERHFEKLDKFLNRG